MRNIKFRAWDLNEDEMIPWELLIKTIYNQDFYKNQWQNYNGSHDVVLSILTDQHIILEQFTGLLDKNGIEIYENDIVLAKDHNPDHYRIEFREGGFCGVWGKGDDEWYPVDINHFYDSTGCYIEIIGNIHQA